MKAKGLFASFIYGDTNKPTRKIFWDHLITLNEDQATPWFVRGDFNDFICNDEKEGGPARPEGSFTNLRTFFSESNFLICNISEINSPGADKGVITLVRCRLDRAVANISWAELFSIARCHYLNNEGSYHKLLLSILEPHKKKRQGLFRYDRKLKDNLEVGEIVCIIWEEEPNFSVREKIEAGRKAISA